jgi:ABC-type sugar transport system permease subunit
MEKSMLTKRKIDKKLIFYIACFALPVLQFLIFYIGVNFQSILLAFQKYDGKATSFYFDKQDLWVNFQRVYEELTETETLLISLKNSLILWGATSIVGTVAAIFFSYYIYKQKRTGRFFRFILFIPSILPAILLAIVFKLFTGDVIPVLFDAPKVLEAEPSIRFAAVVFYTVWIGFGTQILLYTGTMEQISPAVIEAGALDGVTPMKELWYIVIPEIIPTIGTFLVAGVAGAFINQANLFNFYGQTASSDNYTLGYYMFSMVQKNTDLGYGEAFYPYASAIGLCCTLVAVPPTLLLRKFFARFEE